MSGPNAGGWDVVADGVAFPEAPRWHDGRLWFSDIFGGQVCRVEPGGQVEVVALVPHRPSGLGWRPDGTLLVVSMRDRRVVAVRDGGIEEVADLGAVTGGDTNDMVVDADGRAYVGDFGYDYAGGAPRSPGGLALVDPDGTVRPGADQLWFPNGMAVTPDGAQLLVAETGACRITAFARAGDGTLGARRVFADLGSTRPDGIALDAEGAVWVASPGTGELVRVADGGRVLDRIEPPGGTVQACALGGDDGRTLFACGTPTHDEARARRDRAGRVTARRVEVPGAA